MALKRHKLGYSDTFDFLLLGLVSTENDYRLIWRINRTFNFSFAKAGNHNAHAKNDENELEFSHYTYNDEDSFIFYRLLANKSDKGALLEEYRNIDYLLIISGEFSETFITNLITKLKNIEHIQGVFRLSPGTLKNRERLLF